MVSAMKTLLCALWAVALVCSQLILGCGYPPPPKTITVWPDLPADVQEAAALAAAAWCYAPVGWCPEIVPSGGDSRIVVVDRDDSEMFAMNHLRSAGGTEIVIFREASTWGSDALSAVLIHEFGHFGIDGHAAGGTMTPGLERLSDLVPYVDDAAIAMWCDQQGCPE